MGSLVKAAEKKSHTDRQTDRQTDKTDRWTDGQDKNIYASSPLGEGIIIQCHDIAWEHHILSGTQVKYIYNQMYGYLPTFNSKCF